MSPEERRAIVAEAHARGRKVAAHGMNDTDIRLGLECGVDDFQHLGAEAPEFPADIMAAIRARAQAGPPLYWTPTVGANGLLDYPYIATKPEFVDDRWRLSRSAAGAGRRGAEGLEGVSAETD